jgi:glycosyltransferase involved in cell wall biosynthesis
MRLVLACLPSLGGSAITAVALAHALAGRHHSVAVVAAGPPFACGPRTDPTSGTCTVDGVRFHWPVAAPNPVLSDESLVLPRVADLVGRVAREMDADVVNPHYLGGLLPACALGVAAFTPSTALVASAHGTDVTDPAAGTESLTAALLQGAHAVTVVSPYLARVLARTAGLASRELRVVPNWVDAAPPAPTRRSGTEQDLLLVHASNFRPVKRAERLADALAAAHAVVPSRLLLVGDGPDRAALLARAASLGVGDRVDVLGVLDPRSAHAVVAGADVALLPSASEACSGLLLQALSAGIPSVAYRVGGNGGVVRHGRTGLLVSNEPTAAGFAAAVGRLAGDTERRLRVGLAARVDAARFTQEATVTAYENVFVRALARRTRRVLTAS